MKTISNEIKLGNILISNDKPITLIGGVNVIENKDFTYECAKVYKKVCQKLSINLVFKASYDKANRSSADSFRGPGIDEGLKILSEIKKELDLFVISDVHTPEEALKASSVLDIIQLPAFLARQTDLIHSLANTGKIINIKKSQFISPFQVKNIVDKFLKFGNNQLLLCERGHSFGYDNLIVDMLGFGEIKETCNNLPVIFDVTHSLQRRDAGSIISGGRRNQIFELARSGVGTRIAGIFLESHPNPKNALCDGPCALPLDYLEEFLSQIISVDNLVKSFPKIILE